jgi:hypothetical protein
VVVLDSHVARVAVCESECDSPTAIHGHRLPASAIPFERVEPDCSQYSQGLEVRCGIDRIKQQESTVVVETAKTSSSTFLEQPTSLAVRE